MKSFIKIYNYAIGSKNNKFKLCIIIASDS